MKYAFYLWLSILILYVIIFVFRSHHDWTLVSNSVKAGGNFVVLDLNPATWYNLKVTAHNNAGFSVAEYEFATLTVTGGKNPQTCVIFFYLYILIFTRYNEREQSELQQRHLHLFPIKHIFIIPRT